MSCSASVGLGGVSSRQSCASECSASTRAAISRLPRLYTAGAGAAAAESSAGSSASDATDGPRLMASKASEACSASCAASAGFIEAMGGPGQGRGALGQAAVGTAF